MRSLSPYWPPINKIPTQTLVPTQSVSAQRLTVEVCQSTSLTQSPPLRSPEFTDLPASPEYRS